MTRYEKTEAENVGKSKEFGFGQTEMRQGSWRVIWIIPGEWACLVVILTSGVPHKDDMLRAWP